jgi:hypothetical protein
VRPREQPLVLKVPRDDAPATAVNDLEMEMVLLQELRHAHIGEPGLIQCLLKYLQELRHAHISEPGLM